MSIFDIIVLALLVLGAIHGFRKGVVLQIFGLLAIFLGVYCAFKFSGLLALIISKWIEIDAVALSVIAFIITVVLVAITVIALGRFLNTLINVAALGFINRLIGAVFAVVQTLFILSAIVYAFSYLDISKDKSVSKEFTKSKLYQPMKQVAEKTFPYLNFNKLDKKD